MNTIRTELYTLHDIFVSFKTTTSNNGHLSGTFVLSTLGTECVRGRIFPKKYKGLVY